MQYILDSPMVKTMLAFNALVMVSLFLPAFWPLPSIELGNGPEIKAEDIADYLGDGSLPISEAMKRPLFHSNRRPAVVAVAKPVAAAKPEVRVEKFTLELVGIMGATAQSRTAFLLDTETTQTHSVKTGHILNGWTIGEIGLDVVLMNKELEQKTLSLN